MSKNDEEDYEIGYGKPPKHTQFQKGQSGNRRGRPKGVKNTGSAIRTVIDREVTIRENGKQKQVPFMEAYMQKLMEKALNGSTSDQIKLLKVIADYAPDLLKGPEQSPEHMIITTRLVMPDGKTEIDYRPRPISDRNAIIRTNLVPIPDQDEYEDEDEDEDWLK